MDIATFLSGAIELLKFAFNFGEFVDIVLASLKEHYPFLFKDNGETPAETDAQ